MRKWLRVLDAALRATWRTKLNEIVPRHLKVLRSRGKLPYWGKIP